MFLNQQNIRGEKRQAPRGTDFGRPLSDEAAPSRVLGNEDEWAYTEIALDSPQTSLCGGP